MPDLADRINANVDRITRDIGHAINGNLDRISEETRRDLAEAVRNHMEGRIRVEIPVNDRVTLEGRRERDGTIISGIRIDF